LAKLYRIYDEFGPYACHTHCKSIHYPEAEREKQREIGWKYDECCCPIYEGDIDFQKVADILRKHKYAGDLCIENESLERFPKDQRAVILKKEADLLRKLAGSV
jgi:sugar phosphate isomerase/epimerase